MRLPSFILVLLAATVLAVVHVNAAESEPKDPTASLTHLADWVGAARPSSAARPLGHYSREHEKACFTPNTYCPSQSGTSDPAWRADLTCCQNDYRSYQMMPKAGPTIGSCTVVVWGSAMPVNTNLMDVGPFFVECTLDNAGDVCGPSGCEDLVLQAQGTTYTTIVATSHAPITPTQSCPTVGELPAAAGGRASSAVRSYMPLPDNSTTGGGPHELFIGYATYMCGPATISSKKHDVKWEKGWFSLIVPGSTGLANPNFSPISINKLNSLPYQVSKVHPEEFWAYNIDFESKEQGGYAHTHEKEA